VADKRPFLLRVRIDAELLLRNQQVTVRVTSPAQKSLQKQKIVTRWMATICFWVTPESHRD
jgi:hypothetical protein